MYYNLNAKYNNKEQTQGYNHQYNIHFQPRIRTLQHNQPVLIRLQSKQIDNRLIGCSPIKRTPTKKNKDDRFNVLYTQSAKSSNHKKYFEKPEFRPIKPVSSTKIINSANTKCKSPFYASSDTQSTTAQISQISYKPQPISLDWNYIRRKTDTNLFEKFNFGCNIQKPKFSSFCNCQKPCQWAKRWSAWSKMPKQSIYSHLKQRNIKADVNEQIKKDLTRTHPGSYMLEFSYIRMLRQVLEVYSKYDQAVGYVQGMNMLTSVILHHVKNPQQTFWILVDIMQRREYRQLYLNDFSRLKVHTEIINRLVKYKINDLYVHLVHNGIQLQMVTTGWFLSLMCNMIPLVDAHLMLDAFITQGFLGFYKVIITYLLYLKQELMLMNDASDILNRFSSSRSQEDVDWDQILQSAFDFRLDEGDIRILS